MTIVTAQPALAATAFVELVAPGEEVMGHLVVRAARRQARVAVGRTVLERGIVIGRYDRCDGLCPRGWLSDAVSRVHAFVLLENGRLHVVDAGSTNGTRYRNQRLTCDVLLAATPVEIPDGSLTWEPAQ